MMGYLRKGALWSGIKQAILRLPEHHNARLGFRFVIHVHVIIFLPKIVFLQTISIHQILQGAGKVESLLVAVAVCALSLLRRQHVIVIRGYVTQSLVPTMASRLLCASRQLSLLSKSRFTGFLPGRSISSENPTGPPRGGGNQSKYGKVIPLIVS